MNLILSLKPVKLPRINEKFYKNFSLRPEYRDRKELITREIKQQSEELPKIFPPYSVLVNVGTHLDIDSWNKPVWDAMQDAKVIDNDKNILHVEIFKTVVKKNEPNWIEIYLGNYNEQRN